MTPPLTGTGVAALLLYTVIEPAHVVTCYSLLNFCSLISSFYAASTRKIQKLLPEKSNCSGKAAQLAFMNGLENFSLT